MSGKPRPNTYSLVREDKETGMIDEEYLVFDMAWKAILARDALTEISGERAIFTIKEIPDAKTGKIEKV